MGGPRLLAYSRVSAAVHSAAVNRGHTHLFGTPLEVLLGLHREVGLLDHVVIVWLKF